MKNISPKAALQQANNNYEIFTINFTGIIQRSKK